MLNFNTFELALLELREIHENSIKLSELLGSGVIEFSSGVEAALLQVLEEVTEDRGDWISWWLYEDGPKVVTLKHGTDIDISTPVALYNFLALERENGKDA